MSSPENTPTSATAIGTPQVSAGTSTEGEAGVGASSGPPAIESALAAPRCKNCDAVLTGRYCANCGQRADVHVPSTRELVHEALEGLTHSDSRLWRTLLSLWFRPGALTEEFLAGRREISLPPFRLYLIISVTFFLLVSASQTSGVQFLQFDPPDQPAAAKPPLAGDSCDSMTVTIFNHAHPDWDQRIRRACTEIRRDNAKTLKKNLIAALPKAMFVFLPLIAFLHMLLYWRPRRRYAEQLVFFLHLQALFFSVGILIVLLGDVAHRWPSLTGAANVLEPLLGWSLPVYTVLALRRVFKNGWLKTFIKAFGLALAYFLLAVVLWLAAFAYAALEL
jgi:hypothetical protein